jgi:glycosyltransferase involved in cell wall biosynthesis
MKSILYANTIDYDFALQQRPHHIMNILSKRGYMVYWVNIKKNNDKVRDRISDTLHVYHDWDSFKKRVQEVDIYYSSWSFRHIDLNQIKHKIVVYDSLDNFEQNALQEHLMIKKSDILLATSKPLYDLRVNEHDNVYMCRNACFSEYGDKTYLMPSDLEGLKRPIILFSGALSGSWCDLELVDKISKFYTLVVVGMGWGIKNMPPNVHCLGVKKYDELQAYYSHCDISILPFKRCQVSDFSNPIKIYEAMSHGKTTVATNIPESMLYPNCVLPSTSHMEFFQNIKKALDISSDINVIQNCKKIAKENTWENRVNKIEFAINEYCERKNIMLG